MCKNMTGEVGMPCQVITVAFVCLICVGCVSCFSCIDSEVATMSDCCDTVALASVKIQNNVGGGCGL